MDRKPYELILELLRAGDPFRFRFEDQTYSLRRADGSCASTRFPWSARLLEDLEELGSRQPDRRAIKRLGNALRAFLAPLGWGEQERQIQKLLEAGTPVHLICRFAAAELYALPWELLSLEATGQHLGELPGCLIRYEWPGTRTVSPPEPPPMGGRLLFAWSSAGGAVPTERHLSALRQTCARAGHPFDPRRDVVAHASLAALVRAVAESSEPIGALHLLCHGALTSSETQGLVLSSEREGGGPELVDPERVREALAPYAGSIRMVVLCACQSGDSGLPGNPLSGIAQALHRVGIPAVVASRRPLSWEASVLLTETLYDELLGKLSSLQDALLAARRRLQGREGGGPLDWASLQLYARAEDGPDLRPFVFRPYQGLLAFEPRCRRFFFGRAHLEETLFRRVRDAGEGKLPRFQVLAGSSGSGKSSLVMAGLVPALSPEWEILRMSPGSAVDGLPEPLSGLVESVRRRREAKPEGKLLIIVDPFEHLFTRVPASERQPFLDALWELARTDALGTVVLAVSRVDAFERCGELSVGGGGPRLDSIVYDDSHRLFVPQLSPEGYGAVIEGPAKRVGLLFEEGLVELLRRDVGEEPGALPLLQYALDLLWQRREGNRLTHRAYRSIGGVVGALTRAADALYDSLPEEERRQARGLLVRLVELHEASAPYTRRRVQWEQAVPDGAARRAFDAALEKLVAHRLVVRGQEAGADEATTGGWIELSHESLIRRWPRLEEWIREDRDRLLRVREVEAWGHEWRAHLMDPDAGGSYLLGGTRLGYARRLQEELAGELSATANALIDASWARAERAARAEREQRERLQDFTRLLVAEKLRREDPTAALLVLREVMQPERDLTWTQIALELLREPVSRSILEGHEGPLTAMALAADGSLALTASRDGTARVWDAERGGSPGVLRGHGGPIIAAAFSPDGRRVVTASEDGTARIWATDGSAASLVLRGHAGPVGAAAFSPGGERVVTASRDGTARVWRTDGSGRPVVLRGHLAELEAAAFSPEGERIVTASRDGTARVWRADGTGTPVVLRGHTSFVEAAVFSPDGTRVLTASGDGTARVWRADGKGTTVVLQGHPRCARAVAFSPDGSRVLVVSRDGVSRVWRADGSGDPLELPGHGDEVRSAAFSPDGTHVLTASYDGTARIWRADGKGSPRVLRGHRRCIRAAGYSRDGRCVATASDDGTVRIWRAREDEDHLTLQGHTGVVRTVAFSPDGVRVVTAADDRTARVWRADGEGPPLILRGHMGAIHVAAFSPDGARVLTASDDGTARVWPADGMGGPVVLAGHAGRVRAAAFSPEGAFVMTAAWDGTARIWRANGAGNPIVLDGRGGQVRSASISPSGEQVVVVSEDGTARLWRTDGRGAPVVLDGCSGPVQLALFNPTGAQLATASEDGVIRVRSAEGEGAPHPLPGHAGPIRTAAFSPDGKRLAAAHVDNLVRVWDLEKDGEPLVLPGHTAAVTTLAFRPDGACLVSAGGDGTARLWPANGRGGPVLLEAHAGLIHAAAFSPEGGRIALAPADGTIRIWTLSVEALRARLRAATSARLGPRERQWYLGEGQEGGSDRE